MYRNRARRPVRTSHTMCQHVQNLARNAAEALREDPVYGNFETTWSRIVEEGTLREVRRLAKLKNDGRPFPPAQGKPRMGPPRVLHPQDPERSDGQG